MLSVKSAYPIQSMVKHANFNKKLEKNLNRKTWKKPYRDADEKLIARILKSQMSNRSASLRNLES